MLRIFHRTDFLIFIFYKCAKMSIFALKLVTFKFIRKYKNYRKFGLKSFSIQIVFYRTVFYDVMLIKK